MTWDQITHWLDKFTDKPIVYYTLCVVIGVVAAFVILSKTSIGRKALKELRSLFSRNEKTAKETLEKVKDIEIVTKNETASLKAEYEQKLAILISIVNFYEETLFEILELIPNAKVQARLAVLKESYIAKKKEITDTIGVIYQDYELTIKNTENAIHEEYEEKIKYLEGKISEMGLFLAELKEGKDDGEKEERENSIDTNPTKEEIQEN